MGGINWAGAAAGFQGYKDEERRSADDARRAKADGRADQDAAFQEEARGRQRKDWSEADRIKAADKADRAAIAANSAAQQADPAVATPPAAEGIDPTGAAAPIPIDTAPPSASAAAGAPSSAGGVAPASAAAAPKPAVIAPAAGIPKPRNFNDILDQQAELLRRKTARGDLSATDYAQQVSTLNKFKSEGVTTALDLMAQGRYDDAMTAYNGVGAMRGAKIVKGEQGVTKINGQDTPTHFVTIANADGSQAVMDVTKARYQLMDLNTQLQHQDKAATTAMTAKHYADSAQLARDQLAQSAKDAAASRAIQSAHIGLAREQFAAGTPLGQIAQAEKVLGRPLSASEKAAKLGIDTMPVATRLQVTSLFKEQDQISQAMNKAQADGTWQPDSVGGKDMRVRSALINQRLADLMPTTSQPGAMADPANINGAAKPGRGATTVPRPFQAGGTTPAGAGAAPPPRQVIRPDGGARPPSAAAEAPSYEGWRTATQRLDEVNAAAANMSAVQAEAYRAARLPELEAAVQFQSNYKKY